MAKTSKIAKTERQNAAIVKSQGSNAIPGKVVFQARQKNRCQLCGRPRGFMRRFGICRICFRGMAHRGLIPGVTKSSW